MKTKEQIQEHLKEIEQELIEAREWGIKAYNNYLQDKKVWGEGDYGETSAAHSVIENLTSRYNTLMWVLEFENPNS